MIPEMPGSVSTNLSKFDGASEISVSPAWVQTSRWVASIRLGAYRSSKMEPGAIVIKAVYEGVESIERLRFNIDGTFEELKPLDSSTTYEEDDRNPGLLSVRRFHATDDLIRRAVNATNTIVRMDFRGTYLDGEFGLNQAHFAKPAFKKFLTALENQP